jgi:hypothetical protein
MEPEVMGRQKKADYGWKLPSRKKSIMWNKSMNNMNCEKNDVMKDMGYGERNNYVIDELI